MGIPLFWALIYHITTFSSFRAPSLEVIMKVEDVDESISKFVEICESIPYFDDLTTDPSCVRMYNPKINKITPIICIGVIISPRKCHAKTAVKNGDDSSVRAA